MMRCVSQGDSIYRTGVARKGDSGAIRGLKAQGTAIFPCRPKGGLGTIRQRGLIDAPEG